jgi:hypothetical protein
MTRVQNLEDQILEFCLKPLLAERIRVGLVTTGWNQLFGEVVA